MHFFDGTAIDDHRIGAVFGGGNLRAELFGDGLIGVDALAAFGAVGGKKSIMSLFATHPALEDRIEALERLQRGV